MMKVIRHRDGAIVISDDVAFYPEPDWSIDDSADAAAVIALNKAGVATIDVDGDIVPDLIIAKSRKWTEIKAAREARRLVAPTSYGALDVDEIGRSNILGMLQAIDYLGDGVPEPIMWKMNDNGLRPFTRAEFRTAALQALAHIQHVYATSFALEAAKDAATTLAEVEAVTWPE